MKRTAHLTLALLAGAAACDDDGTSVTVSSLVGTWVATSALFTSVANPLDTFDAIVDGDAALTLVIRSDDTVTLTVTESGFTDVDNGTIAVDGSMVTLELDGDVSTGTISRDGDRLQIGLDTDVSFDFGAGEEPATLDLTLTRS